MKRKPSTAFRARLPPRQCLSACEEGSTAAGQGCYDLVMTDVRYEVADDGVATLTFTRPEVMNAIRPEMSQYSAMSIP